MATLRWSVTVLGLICAVVGMGMVCYGFIQTDPAEIIGWGMAGWMTVAPGAALIWVAWSDV